ncbi:MAG: hypothetical protein CVU78_04735 [Elusimicrobia bacterium HGW-Elusimicrobia-2]|nr:MAG: hypothetical protein CVU78_04735 [Elusimicrobia bacterium HGW-Elusimicrobia-2]
MLKKLNGRIFAKDARAGQSIVLAVITITFMAGIGYALVMWSRAQSRQAVQKEQHGSAEEIGKSCIDQAVYEIMYGAYSGAGGYTWGDNKLAGGDNVLLQMTLPDGTTVGVLIEEIGDIAIEP